MKISLVSIIVNVIDLAKCLYNTGYQTSLETNFLKPISIRGSALFTGRYRPKIQKK